MQCCDVLADLLWGDIDSINTSDYNMLLPQTSLLSFLTLHVRIDGFDPLSFMPKETPFPCWRLALERWHKGGSEWQEEGRSACACGGNQGDCIIAHGECMTAGTPASWGSTPTAMIGSMVTARGGRRKKASTSPSATNARAPTAIIARRRLYSTSRSLTHACAVSA